MKSLFLKSKPCRIFLLLKDSEQAWYASKLARAANTSYVHATNLLSNLVRMGAVSCEKKGKQRLFKLTEKGAYLALTLDDFVKKYDALEHESKQPPAAPAPPAHAPAEIAAQKKEEKTVHFLPEQKGTPSPEAKRAEKK